MDKALPRSRTLTRLGRPLLELPIEFYPVVFRQDKHDLNVII